jgi:hypothetical protein
MVSPVGKQIEFQSSIKSLKVYRFKVNCYMIAERCGLSDWQEGTNALAANPRE